MNLCHFVKFMIFDICFNKKKVRLTMLLALDNNSSMLGTLGMALLAKLFAYPLSLLFFCRWSNLFRCILIFRTRDSFTFAN